MNGHIKNIDAPFHVDCFPGGTVVENLPASAGDAGSIPGPGRYPEGGNGSPLHYCCLENPVDRGA